MSDETNEQPNTEPSNEGSPDVESAADVAAAAAKLAAEAAKDAPAPSESDAQAVEAAADTAKEALVEAEAAAGGPEPVESAAFNLENFDESASSAPPGEMSLLDDVNLDVKIELGRTRMFVEDVLKLSDGAVVELDKLAGDPVDIYVNNRHVARGEVLVLNDNFCVRVSEILDPSVDEPKK